MPALPPLRPLLPWTLAACALLPGCDVADPAFEAAASSEVSEAAPVAAVEFVAEPAPDWTAVFQRTSGWLSADGIFSIPLNGVDAPGTAAQTSTAFHFSDTLIGEVEDGEVQPGAVVVNNTLAWFEGAGPDPEGTRFIYATDANGRPRANFIPSTPNAEEGDLYWLGDGFVNQARRAVYIFGAHLRPEAGQPFGLRDLGRNLIVLPAGSRPPFDDQRQIQTPLFRPAGDGRGDIHFGNGILVNTAAAGAPEPDGYVYVYGIEAVPYNKKLLVARVRPEAFEDFAQWRFWDGRRWVPDMMAAAPLTQRVSSELSVTPMGGYYVLVFQLDTIGSSTAVRLAPSPVGPFWRYEEVYRCPEVDLDPDFFCYNAKAHPHLSGPDELLISYNVNSWDFLGDFSVAHTLHPRFFRLRLAE
jgi:hypothetical protein